MTRLLFPFYSLLPGRPYFLYYLPQQLFVLLFNFDYFKVERRPEEACLCAINKTFRECIN